ncbi:MAG: hypothetical protein DHS20C08_11040 [Rhodomicrobium sp.]|nr:MAG: hypothetical protein DHS20C08_11040 [Rhodomicrobium sp.]
MCSCLVGLLLKDVPAHFIEKLPVLWAARESLSGAVVLAVIRDLLVLSGWCFLAGVIWLVIYQPVE